MLLSDGQNTAGRSPTQEAAAAGKAKVPIYTIAYGTENGYVDLDGKREQVPPDTELLQSDRQSDWRPRGGLHEAENLPASSTRCTRTSGARSATRQVKKETTALWAGYGLAFAVVAALAAVSLGARWP